MPLPVEVLTLPEWLPTVLMGACLLSDVQPASQKPINETAARRLNVKSGLPVLIYPPCGKTVTSCKTAGVASCCARSSVADRRG